ncbi:hypothetical protein MBM_08929 [Drepanopeziza brunnea f. sp. 'multigermtubi' MB_m1]|uniref:Uncharacterized protein n=1 Tax=Marssonina brunnea f. sp. multigermtubi (strain MB_m1) TaxID=1072389 RepID=K1W7C9_MARBU|nr:uncharacterized protein MBM_08929 [Drepanopeziza brunnea f. sp. 'multigermtubi' MB_m1]EKD12975.1 hypothetical protein MBM_08929 [Drepanopeziza brunnea f. sp. 'multigermtubi' MB_m1]
MNTKQKTQSIINYIEKEKIDEGELNKKELEEGELDKEELEEGELEEGEIEEGEIKEGEIEEGEIKEKEKEAIILLLKILLLDDLYYATSSRAFIALLSSLLR